MSSSPTPICYHQYNIISIIITILTIIPTIYTQNNMTTTTTMPITTNPTTTFMTTPATPALTVDPTVVVVLTGASGGQLNITNKYCEWNVTNMISVINKTSPTFLYNAQYIPVITALLPESVLRQFPSDLLQFYGLNYTGPAPTECDGGEVPIIATIALPSIDLCVGPLLHTDLPNPVNEDAGNIYIYNIIL